LSALKFLTVEQALKDAAVLIEFLQLQLPIDYNVTHLRAPDAKYKVFAFGGSYSGGLSAWFRVAYPQHTVGALSSSGVVNAILDHWQFDSSTATAIGPTCANRLRAITAAYEAAWIAGRGPQIKALYNAQILSDLDFHFAVADGAAMVVQYSNKARLCSAILANPSPTQDQLIQILADFIRSYYGAGFVTGCFYDTKCIAGDKARWGPMARSWRYQTCTQVAWLQSAPAQGSLRPTNLTLPYFLKQCEQMFATGVLPDVDTFNARYGGDRPKATNVFFSDFSDDPWQTASVNRTTAPSLPYSMVRCDGCGHCKDLHSPSASDPAVLTTSRKLFEQFMGQWLA